MMLLHPTLLATVLPPLALAQAPQLSGEPVLFGSTGTYPRATQLSSGALLGTYANKSGPNSTITIVASPDSGSTWNVLSTVATAPKTTRDLDNPYVHELPNGDILCAFRNHDRNPDLDPGQAVPYDFYRITICRSTDGGRSWGFDTEPVAETANHEIPDKNGSWEPFLQTALDESIQLYYSRESSNMDQDNLMRVSTDNGASWSGSSMVSGAGLTTRDGMVGVARLAPNSASKVAIFETNYPQNVQFEVRAVRSDDDGATWSGEPRTLVHDPASGQAGAPQIIRVGNRYVASFVTNEDGSDQWPTGATKVKVSYNDGTSWEFKTTVRESPARWPGMLALDDNSFLVLYETGGNCMAQRMQF